MANTDLLGLWTKVERKGERWAETCAEHGDSWRSLSLIVWLELDEAAKWVENYDPEPIPGKYYKVPNTIPVYTSNPTLWISDSILSVAYRYRKSAEAFADEKQKEGYHVTRRFFTGNDQWIFKNLWEEKGIYEIYFAGHGIKDEETGEFGYAAVQGPAVMVRAVDVKPPYRLRGIHAMHCYSQDTGWFIHGTTWGFYGLATHMDLPCLVREKKL